MGRDKIALLAKALDISPLLLLNDEIEPNDIDTTSLPKIVKGVNLSEAQFALYGNTEDLTDEELEDVANYINFLKSKRDK